MLPDYAIGQQSETMCVTRAQYWQAVKLECKEASAKASQYDTCRQMLDDVRVQRDTAQGALLEYRGLDAQRLELIRKVEQQRLELEQRWHTLAVVGIAAASILLGGVVGYGVGAF